MRKPRQQSSYSGSGRNRYRDGLRSDFAGGLARSSPDTTPRKHDIKMQSAPKRRRLVYDWFSRTKSLGALVEHSDGAAILRPAGNVVANRNRPFLAVGDRAHALAGHAARHQIFAHRLGAAGA